MMAAFSFSKSIGGNHKPEDHELVQNEVLRMDSWKPRCCGDIAWIGLAWRFVVV
jgi:hypothetical protein